jgi:heme exporter protein A
MADLRVEALELWRGERAVLSGLSFALASGEALALTGPNGAGKSTLLRALALLPRPSGGTVLWDGEDVAAEPEAHRARLVYLGHRDALKPALSARENLAFAARLRGFDDRAAIDAALETVALTAIADLPARVLSQGQRRRAALARLALAPPPLWLLDEPVAGLDAASERAFARMLARHLDAGGMAVIATHAPIAGAARSLALAPSRMVA